LGTFLSPAVFHHLTESGHATAGGSASKALQLSQQENGQKKKKKAKAKVSF
jgi:hypothetical protein